jgi:hypothetical protein
MQAEQEAMLRRILAECRVLTIAVDTTDGPYAGLLPFALRPDLSAFLVHASALARHTQGLGEGRPFGLVLHLADRPDADPLQLPRVTLQGTAHLVDRGTPAYESGRAAYVARFPASARTFGLGDFNLYELRPLRGRLVTGFAGAVNIGPRTLAGMAGEVDRPGPDAQM